MIFLLVVQSLIAILSHHETQGTEDVTICDPWKEQGSDIYCTLTLFGEHCPDSFASECSKDDKGDESPSSAAKKWVKPPYKKLVDDGEKQKGKKKSKKKEKGKKKEKAKEKKKEKGKPKNKAKQPKKPPKPKPPSKDIPPKPKVPPKSGKPPPIPKIPE